MTTDLLTPGERLRGLRLRQRPYIIYSCLWRRRPQAVSHEDWQHTLSLREAQLAGAMLLLSIPGIVIAAWLFSALGWIR